MCRTTRLPTRRQTRVKPKSFSLGLLTARGTKDLNTWSGYGIPVRVTIAPPPTITSLAPTSGPLEGNTTVTIIGTDFTGATNVSFGGTAGTILTTSATQLTVTTPAHTAGTVDVVVTTPGGTATKTGGFTYVVPAPTIGSLSPMSGPAAGGTTVTIIGTNFTDATSVSFDGVAGTILTTSATQLTVTTPAHAAGAVDVVVTTLGGTATQTGGFTYQAANQPAPTISSLSPTSGAAAGGTTVTIIGTNFTGATNVTFGGVAGTGLSVASDTQLTVTTPAHAAGAVDVVVITLGGTATQTGGFTYQAVAPPTVSTNSASAITMTGATLNGSVNAQGRSTSVAFQLSTTSGDYTHAVTVSATPATVSGTNEVAVSGTASDLQANTTYYYRGVATNSNGTTIGNEQRFTTGLTLVSTNGIQGAPGSYFIFTAQGFNPNEPVLIMLNGQVVLRLYVNLDGTLRFVFFIDPRTHAGTYTIRVESTAQATRSGEAQVTVDPTASVLAPPTDATLPEVRSIQTIYLLQVFR